MSKQLLFLLVATVMLTLGSEEEGEICTICQRIMDMEDKGNIVNFVDDFHNPKKTCEHCLHQECARKWLDDHESCPSCRTKGQYLQNLEGRITQPTNMNASIQKLRGNQFLPHWVAKHNDLKNIVKELTKSEIRPLDIMDYIETKKYWFTCEQADFLASVVFHLEIPEEDKKYSPDTYNYVAGLIFFDRVVDLYRLNSLDENRFVPQNIGYDVLRRNVVHENPIDTKPSQKDVKFGMVRYDIINESYTAWHVNAFVKFDDQLKEYFKCKSLNRWRGD